jgi:acetyltransferase-like isoleucine patch superfamily enzyme
MIDIHPDARVSKFSDIEDSVRGCSNVFGANSMTESFVKIKSVVGTRAVIIGTHTYINTGCVLYSGNGIAIGDNVAIAVNCSLAPVNQAYQDRERFFSMEDFIQSKGGILMQDDVWIGANCVILDGAILREVVVIAGGSIVLGELQAYGIHAGFPLQLKGCLQ